jgi:serine phosphatase RsbU (regulator of sigma subunit)
LVERLDFLSVDQILPIAGALRGAYSEVDFASGPLGPVSGWSPALRGALDMALHTRFPVTLLWGPEHVLLYNEAYVPLIQSKHPHALGAPARDIFPEVWDVVGPMMEQVLAGGVATWVEDAALPLERNGFLEECYFTFSYSPVRGPDRTIEGLIDIATETTQLVLDRRRLQLLSRLRDDLADLQRAEEVPKRALAVLREARDDLAAVDIRLQGNRTEVSDLRLPPGAPARRDGRDLVLRDRVAWITLTHGDSGAEPSVLVVQLSDRLPVDDAYLDFLRLIASSISQALDRVSAREAERAAASAERGMSEVLQRSLLTQPSQPDQLQVAVRYQPASELVQVGGDWYDAFVLPDGALTLVIGDVAGHDRQAAAAMAQVRNLLRGISYSLQKPPAAVLAALDQALLGLDVDAVATAVLSRVEPIAGGGRTVRWCNAGHPPPVLLSPDGSAELLETPPDLLLGLQPDIERADHTLTLDRGSSLVFYTDGLIERRGAPLQNGLAWLLDVLQSRQDLTADEISDLLLTQIDGTVEDDIALLVLRVLG